MQTRGANKVTLQRFHPLLAVRPCFRKQFLNPLPHLDRFCCVQHWRPEIYGNRVRNVPRPLPVEMAALETKDAAPDAVERYGDDRRLHILHDALKAAPERKHLADTGN